jgi:outer membrane beta-barrel protein
METRTAMKLRFVRALLAVVAGALLLLTAGVSRAQEIQLTGPLKGAPAVRHLRYYREGRFNFAPAVSFTLLDEYRRTIIVGARLEYNITDWFALGVWGGYGAFSLTTDLTDQINAKAPHDSLTATNVNHAGTDPNNLRPAPFADQTAKIQYVAAPQVTFTPFRGKLAIFNKIFVDTDFYLAGGVGVVGIQQRGKCPDTGIPNCSDPSSFKVASDTRITWTAGAGLTFYPGNFWSLGVEYRLLPFAWNRAGFDTKGGGPNGNFPETFSGNRASVAGDDDTYKINMLVTVSIGFYLPGKPSISQ